MTRLVDEILRPEIEKKARQLNQASLKDHTYENIGE